MYVQCSFSYPQLFVGPPPPSFIMFLTRKDVRRPLFAVCADGTVEWTWFGKMVRGIANDSVPATPIRLSSRARMPLWYVGLIVVIIDRQVVRNCHYYKLLHYYRLLKKEMRLPGSTACVINWANYSKVVFDSQEYFERNINQRSCRMLKLPVSTIRQAITLTTLRRQK